MCVYMRAKLLVAFVKHTHVDDLSATWRSAFKPMQSTAKSFNFIYLYTYLYSFEFLVLICMQRQKYQNHYWKKAIVKAINSLVLMQRVCRTNIFATVC